MADVAAFRQVLQRCGFSQNAANCIVAEGYNDLMSITELNDHDVIDMVKNLVRRYSRDDALNDPVNFPQRAVNKFRALRYYMERETMLHVTVEPGDLITENIQAIFREWDAYKQLLEAQETHGVAEVPELKMLKEYQTWVNLLNTHLLQVRGSKGSPLAYLVRPESQVTQAQQEADYETIDSRLIALTPHLNASYEADNNRLFDLIKPLLRNGEGWNVVRRYDRTRNGRQALLALKTQCLGDAQQSFRRDQAYLSLQKARYNGERRNFGFQTYVGIHRKAHDELLELGEVLTEERKVSLFMTGIRTADMNGGKAVVRSRPDYKSDFETCQAFLNQFVNESEAQDALQHQIGSTGTRQRQTGKKHEQTPTRRNGPTKKHYGPGFIKNGDWLRMSKKEKSDIYRKREQAEKQANSSDNRHSVSSSNSNTHATPSELSTTPVPQSDTPSRSDTGGTNNTGTEAPTGQQQQAQGMGDQFGRRAYRNSSVTFNLPPAPNGPAPRPHGPGT